MASLLKRSLLILLASILLIEATLHGIAWMMRDEADHLDALGGAGKIRILCIGDSNTYGLYLEKHQSWPAQLQNILDERNPETFQVINLGYPGTPTYRIAESLQSWIHELQPDMVIILAGVNDIFYGAIPANTASTENTVSLHALLIRYSRIYRLIRLSMANMEQPEINSDADLAMDTMRNLKSIEDEKEIEEAIALIFGTYFQIDGISVVHEKNGLWITKGDTSISALSIGKRLKAEAPFEQVRIIMDVLLQLGVQESHLTTSGNFYIGGKAYELNLDREKQRQKNTNLAIADNFTLMLGASLKSGVKPLFLTYASSQSFYAQANEAIRDFASSRNASLIDVGQRFRTVCPSKDCQEYFFQDQHPNAEGYRAMAEIIADALLPASGSSQPDR